MSLGEHARLPVGELRTFHKNPRKGDVEAIAGSLRVNQQYRPIVVNRGTHTGRPNEVLAGNHTLMAARSLAEEDKAWNEIDAWVIDVDDDQASRIVLADNRTADLGSYNDHALLGLLEQLDGDLEGTGFDDHDVQSLEADLESIDSDYDSNRADQYDEGAAAKPVKRELPVDMIFSSSGASYPATTLSYAMGWNPGIITTAVGAARLFRERFPRGKPIMFMDNEWHGYNHEQHVAAISEFHPKYATVRDLVTKKQAQEFGVEYFTVAQTLDMARDVAEHCDNVILIPKYDCLEQLPDEIGGKRVVLGYSVDSSYGGTELPPERFKGWPVHLLGGPWKKQRALMNVLKDDIVSIDNNNLLKIAQFGQVNMGDGSVKSIDDVIGYQMSKNHMVVAMMLSLANIMCEIVDVYGVEEIETTANDEIEELAEFTENETIER